MRNQRQDWLHKLTTGLVQKYDGLCIEDLNLKGMARTKLSTSVLDAALGEFRRQLEYKTVWHRKHLADIRGCPRCQEAREAAREAARWGARAERLLAQGRYQEALEALDRAQQLEARRYFPSSKLCRECGTIHTALEGLFVKPPPPI